MNPTTALYLALAQIAAEIVAAKLGGTAADIIKVSEGSLKLLQVALAIHLAESGSAIDDVVKSLEPYTPIGS